MDTKIAVGCLASMLAAGAAVPSIAQEKQETIAVFQDPPEVTIQTVGLSFQSARALQKMIDSLDAGVSTAAINDRQIVIRGPQKIVAQILETVVKAYDVPDPDAGTLKTVVLPLPMGAMEVTRTGLSRSRTDLAAMLRIAAGDSDRFRFIVDENSRRLVIRGTESEIASAQRMLESLARTAARAVLVECFFIRAKLDGDGAQTQSSLPKRLDPVGQALAANGLTNLSLLAPMMIYAREGEKFTSSATYTEPDSSTDPEVTKGYLTFDVSGTATLSDDSQTAEITINAQVKGQYSNANTAKGDTAFQIYTAVGTSKGDYAILATAPSSTASGDVIALAVRLVAR